MQKGKYKWVKITQTTVDELYPYIDTFGQLIITPHNEVVFDVADKHFKYPILISHEDFSRALCDEVWVGTNEGDITFKRKRVNEL